MNEEIENIKKILEQKQKIMFGEFILEGVLGSGQQGIIVKAKNANGKYFAIKFYYPSDTEKNSINDGIKRFKRKVNILLTLKHKNIVKRFRINSVFCLS